jgi:hypothetical protein
MINNEHDVPFWRCKGWGGDRTLVCLHRYTGTEDGRLKVPLIARGRIAGQRRAHFAHPAGMCPPTAAHHPESVWHAHGKQYFAAWARQQPGVREAVVEAWTPDGRRRSDVRITFAGGEVVALELQNGPITDSEWLERHRDYQRVNTVDVWLWHPRTGIPGIIVHYGQPGWVHTEDPDWLRISVALSHDRPERWWELDELDAYGMHWPPHPADRTRLADIHLDQIGLTPTGLNPRMAVTDGWRAQTRTDARHAAAAPAQPIPQPRRPITLSSSLLRSRNVLTPTPSLVRIDAQPPGRDDPELRRFLCMSCNVVLGASSVRDHRACVCITT